MKKLSVIFGIMVAIVCLVGFTKADNKTQTDNFYGMTAKVIEVDRENDVVVIKDFSGYVWEFGGIEDWEVDDIATCVMYDNNTKSILDDEIVNVTYNGYFEGWK